MVLGFIILFAVLVALAYFLTKMLLKRADLKGAEIKAVHNSPEPKEEETINQYPLDNGSRFQFPKGSTVEITEDEFEKSKTLRFTRTGSFGLDKYMVFSNKNEQFFIGFRTENEKHMILFGCLQKEIKLDKGSKVSVLFEDESIQDFILEEKGYKVEKDSDGVVIESYSFITMEMIEKFSEVGVKKWRLYTGKKVPVTGEFEEKDIKNFKEVGFVYWYALEKLYPNLGAAPESLPKIA